MQEASRNHLTGLLAVNAAAMVFGAAALFARLEVPVVWIVAGRLPFLPKVQSILDRVSWYQCGAFCIQNAQRAN